MANIKNSNLISFFLIISILTPSPHSGFYSYIPTLLFITLAYIISLEGRDRKNTLNVVYLFILSILSLSLSELVRQIYLDRTNHEYYFKYLARASYIFILFAILSRIRIEENGERNISISVIFISVLGLIVEFLSKTSGYYKIIDIYKSRNSGDMAIHFERYSGFYSYPGDYSAVLVLSLFLIKFIKLNRYLEYILYSLISLSIVLTQSKAGIILLISTLFVYFSLSIITNKKTEINNSIKIVLIFMLLFSYLFAWKNLDYFSLFMEKKDYYVKEGKRASEISEITGSSIGEILFGIRNPQHFYESEWAGYISRVGLVGSLPIIISLIVSAYLILICVKKRISRYIGISSFYFCYISIYCLGSAGLSRPKLSLTILVSFYFFLYLSMKEEYSGSTKMAKLK